MKYITVMLVKEVDIQVVKQVVVMEVERAFKLVKDSMEVVKF